MNNFGFPGIPLSHSPPFSCLPPSLIFLLIFSGGGGEGDVVIGALEINLVSPYFSISREVSQMYL